MADGRHVMGGRAEVGADWGSQFPGLRRRAVSNGVFYPFFIVDCTIIELRRL